MEASQRARLLGCFRLRVHITSIIERDGNSRLTLGLRATEQRRRLPWVEVEKNYVFDTEDGPRTLAELFDGRPQLLAYNIMFGPDYELGACPGCTSLGDGLDGVLVHLNHSDVTLICFSRAPIDRLIAYKQRMGWQFPYVSTYHTDFPFDFGLAMTPEQAKQVPEVKAMIDDPPEWLEEWSLQTGAKLEDGLREGPGWIAFARENETVFIYPSEDSHEQNRCSSLQLPHDATRLGLSGRDHCVVGIRLSGTPRLPGSWPSSRLHRPCDARRRKRRRGESPRASDGTQDNRERHAHVAGGGTGSS